MKHYSMSMLAPLMMLSGAFKVPKHYNLRTGGNDIGRGAAEGIPFVDSHGKRYVRDNRGTVRQLKD